MSTNHFRLNTRILLRADGIIPKLQFFVFIIP